MKPFQERLAAAKRYCELATSLQLRPLKNTHVNDVPVLMATFAAAECQELEAEVAALKQHAAASDAALDAILSGERYLITRGPSGHLRFWGRDSRLERDRAERVHAGAEMIRTVRLPEGEGGGAG